MTDEPASRPRSIRTADGIDLEAAWSGPSDPRCVAVLTHPHPSYGGDMHNVVPATLARVLPDHDVATLRFQFRGAGASGGSHGGGGPETGDVSAAVDAALAAHPDRPVVGVGYSFGADVLLATDHPGLAGVVAVAPPLQVLAPEQLLAARGRCPTLLLSAEHDQIRPFDDAQRLTADWPSTDVEEIEGADHFLSGAMSRVAERVVTFLDGIAPAG